MILAFITAKCGRTADIGDIFQDTYMELYKILNGRGVDYVTNEKALVYRIAKRKIARYYSLMQRLKINFKIDGENETELFDLIIDDFVIENYAADQAMLDEAKKLIKSKSEDIKKIFYLFYDLGLTIPEIAESMAISESSVKNKLYRTIKELQNLLK